MVESEIDIYNVKANERKQSLKVSIINNTHISIILTDIETQQRYIALYSLPQLKPICKAFQLTKTIKEALQFIKKGIESGSVTLSTEPNGKSTEINITTGDYPPFDLNLILEQKKNNTGQQKLDYRGNIEQAQNYGKLKYIKGMEGKFQNINNEQFHIKQLSPIKDISNSNYYRANSATRENINAYSIKTNPYLTNTDFYTTINTNHLNINQPNKPINNQLRGVMNNNNINNIYNSLNYQNISIYSMMTEQKRPFVAQNSNYSIQVPNETLYNSNFNNIVERRPRMINQGNVNRSSSTPHNQNQNISRFNLSQSMFQPNPTNNPFQTNQLYKPKTVKQTTTGINTNLLIPFLL